MGRGAPPAPVPARPGRAARTHLAVELADRHDPAGRAERGAPCPADGPRPCPGGGGSAPLAARRRSVRGPPAWRHLPGLPRVWSSPRLSSTCRRSLPARATFTPGRQRRGGRAGVARAGEEAAPRRAPLRYWRRCERGRAEAGASGPRPGPERCRRRGALRGRAGRALPRGVSAGSCGPGAGRGGRAAGAGRPLLDAGRTRDRCAPVPHLQPPLRVRAGCAWGAGRGRGADGKRERSNRRGAKRNRKGGVYG